MDLDEDDSEDEDSEESDDEPPKNTKVSFLLHSLS